MFFDSIWSTRPGTSNLRTGKRACDAYRPDKSLLNGFWERLIKEPPSRLAIAESHADAYKYLEQMHLTGVRLVNFDAHHDCWWKNMGKPKQVNCGNWIYHALKDGMVKQYDLHYPPYMNRKLIGKENIENPIVWPKGENYNDKTNVYYHGEKNRLPRIFHYVFICRSSCWTPPWADREFLQFVSYWKRYRSLWNDRRSTADYAMKRRALNITQARKIAADFTRMWKMHQREHQLVG